MPSAVAASPSTPPNPTVRRILAVTMGDPLGIGPEIIVKALHEPSTRDTARFHVHGLARPMQLAAEQAGISPFWTVVPASDAARNVPPMGRADQVVLIDYSDELAPPPLIRADAHAPTAWGGRASFEFIERAITSTRLPLSHPARASAIVTAPISKTSWTLAGLTQFPGHTELLADRYGATRHAMLFVGKHLRVVLVTIHVPLARVPSEVTTRGVLNTIQLGDASCRMLGMNGPRIAVCGLNPHAGEHGILGEEDDRVILPAVTDAARHGINVVGPLPGDSVFVSAAKGAYDLVVAMYHDQGLIPIKLLEREQTVNVTVGLPHPHATSRDSSEWLIRTSPAHGTAFDIAGQGVANAASMTAALLLAAQLSRERT